MESRLESVERDMTEFEKKHYNLDEQIVKCYECGWENCGCYSTKKVTICKQWCDRKFIIHKAGENAE